MSPINISVVIATRDRVRLLASCLSAFSRQTYDKNLFEIIVINDGSTDGTEAFLSGFKEKTDLNFRYMSHENKGVSYSRNVGIDRAVGHFIAFTDDDCKVPENWLSKIAGLWEDAGTSVAGIGGPLNSHPGNNYISRYIHFLDEFNSIPVLGKYRITHVHVSKLPDNAPIAYLRTSNAVFRKRCVQEVGGFDIAFKRPGGEDPDLCYRILNLGLSFHLDKDLVVLHKNRDSIKSYFGALKSYIGGEFRQKSKIHCYRIKSIRRSCVLIPAQKLAALGFSLLTAPIIMAKLFYRSQFSLIEKSSFPFLFIASKLYALGISLYFQARYSFSNLI